MAAGNYRPGSGVPKTKDAPGVAAGLNMKNFPKPKAQSNSTSVSGPAYQPFPHSRNVAGTGGVMSTLHGDASFGKLNSPVKQALASRKFKPSGDGGKATPSSMLGGKANAVKPTGGMY